METHTNCTMTRKLAEYLTASAVGDNPEKNHTHVYLALYESADLKSRKECTITLLFGESNDRRVTYAKPNDRLTIGKYEVLPCPVCGFSHQFKRSTWWEGLPLPISPNMFDEEEESE